MHEKLEGLAALMKYCSVGVHTFHETGCSRSKLEIIFGVVMKALVRPGEP